MIPLKYMYTRKCENRSKDTLTVAKKHWKSNLKIKISEDTGKEELLTKTISLGNNTFLVHTSPNLKSETVKNNCSVKTIPYLSITD